VFVNSEEACHLQMFSVRTIAVWFGNWKR